MLDTVQVGRADEPINERADRDLHQWDRVAHPGVVDESPDQWRQTTGLAVSCRTDHRGIWRACCPHTLPSCPPDLMLSSYVHQIFLVCMFLLATLMKAPEMSGFVYFVLGLAASIPIAIYAPFGTARLQQRRGERNRRAAARRREQLDAQRKEVTLFHENRDQFIEWLIHRLILIAFATAFTVIAPSLLAAIGNGIQTYQVSSGTGFSRFLSTVPNYFYLASSLAAVIASVYVVQICTRTTRVYKVVRNYDDYVSFVEDQLSRLQSTAPPKDVSKGDSTLN